MEPKSKVVRAGVPEIHRTYSSVYANEKAGSGHARSTLNSPQAWSAAINKAGQWIQMDLGQTWSVAGTVIQPRVGNSQFVTKYTVSTSVDGEEWYKVPETFKGHGSDTIENRFSEGDLIRARYVRIIVGTWSGHISLRADVLISVGINREKMG